MTRRSSFTRHLNASQKAKRHWSLQRALGHWVPEIDKATGKPASPRPASSYRGARRNWKYRRGHGCLDWWLRQADKTTDDVARAA
jgi:hypothetical protein